MLTHTLRPRNLPLSFLALLICCPAAGWAQEAASVSAPAFVTFNVADVSKSSTASPSSVTVSFNSAALNPGMRLSISVMADSTSFDSSSGSSIAASNVSWTAGGVSGGTGYSGTLSGATFTEIYRSAPDPSSGSVQLTFTLDAPGGGVDAGDHSLNLVWKFDSTL